MPLRLKAQILSTLAAFAKSPEIASSMWHTLELSQVHCLVVFFLAYKLCFFQLEHCLLEIVVVQASLDQSSDYKSYMSMCTVYMTPL